MKAARKRNTEFEPRIDGKSTFGVAASFEISVGEKKFIKSVRERTAVPLSILCKLIPSQKSMQVQKTGMLSLCRAILVDTCRTWTLDADSGDNEMERGLVALRESALECIIIMLDDHHGGGKMLT